LDKLDQIFEMQRELNNYTFEKNSIPITFDAIPKSRHLQNEWINNFATALSQEVSELRDSTNWKWWRTKVDLFDKQNVCVELIDILHFWVSACQVLGLTPDDIYQIYAQKNAVNIKRQDSGYIEKTEDCKNIKVKDEQDKK